MTKTPRKNLRSHNQPLKMIGQKLRFIRQSKNISVERASQSLRVSSTRLQAIENGEKNYSLALLVRICNYYKVCVLDVV